MLMEQTIYLQINKINFSCKIFATTMKKVIYDYKRMD